MLPTPYNVIWSTPSADASGSMPLGNGSIALNLWVEAGGDLCVYLARADSWGEYGQLYKVGRVRVKLFTAPDTPLLTGDGFHWALKLEDGMIHVRTARGEARIWVDAHHPVVRLEASGPDTLHGEIHLELWRHAKRRLEGQEHHSLHPGAPYAVYHFADHVVDAAEEQLIWYHHNETSSWRNSLAQQGLDHFAATQTDPLLHRCFGGLIHGDQFVKTSPTCLRSRHPGRNFSTSIVLACGQHQDPSTWIRQLKQTAAALPPNQDTSAWQAHRAWWHAFWERSWIHADGSEAARKVSRGYALQRFINACAGRGEFPIKFNGSLFTVDWKYDGEDHGPNENYDADYRRWEPGYWHQNTRLPYWAMLLAGDFEMMRPYFDQYLRILPLARERCARFCGHPGAFFSETMSFWGAYWESNYGWPAHQAEGDQVRPIREPGLPAHLPQNQYIRLHHSSGLEIVHHALLYFKFTADQTFLETVARPLAEAVIDYYDHHFSRQNGLLHIAPAQAIEQWWVARDPRPEVAGLKACLQSLLSLDGIDPSRRRQWQRLESELPELPTRTEDNVKFFAPAHHWEGPPRNAENPELYAIFPYHRCHLDSPDLAVGRESFRRRAYTHDQGWA